jgi:transcription elongation factor S-II
MSFNIKSIKEPETFRKNVIDKLNSIIHNDKKCINIEKSIYNYTIKEATQRQVVKKWDNKYFIMIYMNRFRSLWMNIWEKSGVFNTEFLENIKTGVIESKKVAFMTHHEIAPDKWKKLIEDKVERDKNKYEVDKRGATDEFKCRKCGERQCTYYQLQTRSADEPMTTFVSCLNCGNNWKC